MTTMTVTDAVYISVQNNEPREEEHETIRRLVDRTVLPYSSVETYNDISSHTATILGYTAVGAGIGAASGIPFGPMGIGVGAGIGAGAGAGFGCYRVYKDRINAFEKWKEEVRDPDTLKEIVALFKEQFPEEPAILCQSDDMLIMSDPLITPCGHTFDKHVIRDWLVKHGKGTCIKCIRPVTFDQLKVDYLALGRLNILGTQLLTSKSQQLQLTPKQRKGVEALAKDTQDRVKVYFKREEDTLMDQRKEDRITPQQFVIRYKNLMMAFSMADSGHRSTQRKEERKG